jgi:2-isopropylmalate synthase
MHSQIDRVLIFDTTLRDGEQSPGISLNPAEKLEIAQQLARLGVDVIEAGFPIASPGDFEAVLQGIARQVEGPVIAGLARTHFADIESAASAVADAERPRIHTFISTSDIHITSTSCSPRARTCWAGPRGGRARARVRRGRRVLADGRDALRARVHRRGGGGGDRGGRDDDQHPRHRRLRDAARVRAWLERLYELVPALHDVVLSVHCHDDLGLAVANSFAGVRAGARQVECAINGIGERAGNASLEEIVMLLHTRAADIGLETAINTREIARTSRLVSRLTGYAVQPNKAIVGRNAFAHESGIHQDGVLKERTTYEIMDATSVGLAANSLVLGKHSGRHALRQALENLGIEVQGQALNVAFKRFKEIADRKKTVTAMDLEALVTDELRENIAGFTLESYEVSAASGREPRASVSVRTPAGEIAVGEYSGDGSVDSVFGAINARHRSRRCAARVSHRRRDRGSGRARRGLGRGHAGRAVRLRPGGGDRRDRGRRAGLPARADHARARRGDDAGGG